MKRILIVEDDNDLAMAFAIQLKAAGYQPVIAGDGVEAVKAVAQTPPDLILLDIGIPAGNGLWVLENIRRNLDTTLIPVIVMTGRDPDSIKDQALELGISMFCEKPVDNVALMAKIRECTSGDEPA